MSKKPTKKRGKLVKVNMKYLHLCQNFWLIATLIRRGRQHPQTKRWTKLTYDEMNEILNHYLMTFEWPKCLLERIGELQEIVYNKMLEEQGNVQESNQTDGGPLRSASESA